MQRSLEGINCRVTLINNTKGHDYEELLVGKKKKAAHEEDH